METAMGVSESTVFTVGATNIPTVTIPAVPVWATGANVYLTLANGASGTEVQYATGVGAGAYSMSVANTGTVPPPNTSRLPSARLACASLASGHLTSAAYGCPSPWSRRQYLEFYRHFIKYNTVLPGQIAANIAAAATYVPVGSQPVGFVPALIGYEGSLQTISNFNVSQVAGGNQIPEASGYYLANSIAHDCYYDPEIYWCDMAAFQMNQQAGMAQFNCLSLCMPLAGGGAAWNAAIYLWGYCLWHGQPSGRGDGTVASNGQNITNLFWIDTGSAQHLNNAAVRLQALQDWVDSANAPPPPPAPAQVVPRVTAGAVTCATATFEMQSRPP